MTYADFMATMTFIVTSIGLLVSVISLFDQDQNKK